MTDILEKEHELTRYLDTHIDYLFDRVDNILEEFGISSSPENIMPVSESVSQHQNVNTIPVGTIEQNSTGFLNISSSNDISKSLSAISYSSSGIEENVPIPTRVSIDSDILPHPQQQHKSRLEPESEQTRDMKNHSSSQIGSRSPFFYLSSSFESEVSSIEASANSSAPIAGNAIEHGKAETMEMPDIYGHVAESYDDVLTEDFVKAYLYDDVVRLMWNRLKNLEAMFDMIG